LVVAVAESAECLKRNTQTALRIAGRARNLVRHFAHSLSNLEGKSVSEIEREFSMIWEVERILTQVEPDIADEEQYTRASPPGVLVWKRNSERIRNALNALHDPALPVPDYEWFADVNGAAVYDSHSWCEQLWTEIEHLQKR